MRWIVRTLILQRSTSSSCVSPLAFLSSTTFRPRSGCFMISRICLTMASCIFLELHHPYLTRISPDIYPTCRDSDDLNVIYYIYVVSTRSPWKWVDRIDHLLRFKLIIPC